MLAKNKVICGLDVGTRKVAGCLFVRDKDARRPSLFFASGDVRGLKKGLVSDLALFCDSVSEVLNTLQKKSGIHFKDVYIGIQGGHISCRHSNAAIVLSERGNKLIGTSDIKRINEQARILGLHMDETVLYSSAVNYIIDDTAQSRNPLGLYGHKLEVDLYLITTKVNLTDSIVRAINNAGYNVAGIQLSTAATGISVLNSQEREAGVLLVDMGGEISEAAVFKDGRIKYLQIFEFGADEFTYAIKEQLRISFELAEQIKESYGTIFFEQLDESQEIMINRDGSYVPVRRKAVCSVLSKTSDAILKVMEGRLRYILNREDLPFGIMAVGGGVRLDGLLESMEQVFRIPVKIGNIRQNFLENKDIKYATSLGIVQSVIESNQRMHSSLRFAGGILGRLSEKVKEIYQEYF